MTSHFAAEASNENQESLLLSLLEITGLIMEIAGTL